MANLPEKHLVEIDENFKDGTLFAQLIEAGFEAHPSLPATIRAGSRAYVTSNIKKRIEQSIGKTLPVIESRLTIPPPTGPTSEAKEVEVNIEVDPDIAFEVEGEGEVDPDIAFEVEVEELALEHLDMTAPAYQLAKENNIHPVEILDRFGENHRVTKGDVSDLLEE